MITSVGEEYYFLYLNVMSICGVKTNQRLKYLKGCTCATSLKISTLYPRIPPSKLFIASFLFVRLTLVYLYECRLFILKIWKNLINFNAFVLLINP